MIIGLLGLVFSYQVLISGILVVMFLMGTLLMMHKIYHLNFANMEYFFITILLGLKLDVDSLKKYYIILLEETD